MSPNVAKGTVLTTLLCAYMGFHEGLMENHQCGNPECGLVRVHQQLHDLLHTALDQRAHLMQDCDEEPEGSKRV